LKNIDEYVLQVSFASTLYLSERFLRPKRFARGQVRKTFFYGRGLLRDRVTRARLGIARAVDDGLGAPRKMPQSRIFIWHDETRHSHHSASQSGGQWGEKKKHAYKRIGPFHKGGQVRAAGAAPGGGGGGGDRSRDLRRRFIL